MRQERKENNKRENEMRGEKQTNLERQDKYQKAKNRD